MLTGTQDNETIIERVAALDIGKAELVCWCPVWVHPSTTSATAPDHV